MDMDDEGLVPESLELTLNTHEIKFIYLVPTIETGIEKLATAIRAVQE